MRVVVAAFQMGERIKILLLGFRIVTYKSYIRVRYRLYNYIYTLIEQFFFFVLWVVYSEYVLLFRGRKYIQGSFLFFSGRILKYGNSI